MSMSTNEGNLTRVTADLLLSRVFREDTGIYECSSINILNSATRNINLIVQCTYIINQQHTYSINDKSFKGEFYTVFMDFSWNLISLHNSGFVFYLTTKEVIFVISKCDKSMKFFPQNF